MSTSVSADMYRQPLLFHYFLAIPLFHNFLITKPTLKFLVFGCLLFCSIFTIAAEPAHTTSKGRMAPDMQYVWVYTPYNMKSEIPIRFIFSHD